MQRKLASVCVPQAHSSACRDKSAVWHGSGTSAVTYCMNSCWCSLGYVNTPFMSLDPVAGGCYILPLHNASCPSSQLNCASSLACHAMQHSTTEWLSGFAEVSARAAEALSRLPFHCVRIPNLQAATQQYTTASVFSSQ
jgi:hypothetical protein